MSATSTVSSVGALPVSGIRRAAIFLVQLGTQKAARVMGLLPEPLVEELTAEIVRLKDVSPEDATFVLTQARDQLTTASNSSRGGLDLARQLLAESVGSERADEIMERLGASLSEMPFESMRRADARQ